MTLRLYYTDCYLTRFQSAVTAREQDGKRVYLEETAFYPTSGGQPHDTGRLGGVEVVDVIDEGDRIAHVLAEPFPERPGPVPGEVDWKRRFDHMQQHTGQHLLSGVLVELFGLETASVHFGADSSTLDLAAGALTSEQLRAAEERANEVVTENRPVTVSFEETDPASLRKPSARAGPLRIVAIRDLDRSACGGTHVRATGEIGPILIRRLDRVRKSIRLEFVCGGRAVRRARQDYELLARLASFHSAAPEELPALLEKQRSELKEAAAARRELETELARRRGRELYHAVQPDRSGLRRVIVRDEPGSLESLRGLAQAVTALPQAVFVGAVAGPPGVVLAASEDAGLDAGAALKAALARAGGRGGGNARLAQGTVADPAALKAVLSELGAG